MPKAQKNLPSDDQLVEALKFVEANLSSINDFEGTSDQKAANVIKLLYDNVQLQCDNTTACAVVQYVAHEPKSTDDQETTKFIKQLWHDAMKSKLKASEYIPIITEPLDIILDVARKVFGCCHVFGSEWLLDGVIDRHIVGGKLVETTLLSDIRQHIHKKDNDAAKQAKLNDVTLIVGGPSGGGKTDSLIAQSQRFKDGEPQVVVAYIDPPMGLYNLTAEEIRTNESLTSEGDTPKYTPGLEIHGTDVKARNRVVLDWLVVELFAIIPIKVIQQLMKVTKAKPLQLLIVLDEVGGEGFNYLVRALCAIKPSRIHKLFVKSINNFHKGFDTLGHEFFPHVTFRLAAAGTGIGVSEKFTVGSQPDNFELFSAYDGSQASMNALRASNRDVFMAYFRAKKALDEKRLHRLFWELISENARMAAILGSQLKYYFFIFNKEADRVDLLYMFDLTQFIGGAIFEFKSLNGLKLLQQDELWEILLRAVRMHWFPKALTRGMDTMQTKRGLIVDRSVWAKKASGKPADGEVKVPLGDSPRMMPPFTTTLLGMLCGNPIITQSIVSGASLEEYTLTLFFLLGCAACDSDLFLAALDNRQLVPLADEIKELPRTKDLPLQSVVHDLQRDYDKKGIVTEETKAEKLLLAVTDAIGHFTYSIEVGEPCEHHVAAFRVFDKMSFADTLLIDNGKMFLFQDKDYELGYNGEKLALEQYKMGSVQSTAFQTKNLEYMTPSLEYFKTSLKELVNASKSDKKKREANDDSIVNESTHIFVQEIHNLLQKAKSDTSVFVRLRKLIDNNQTQKPALKDKVNVLVNTSEANMNAKLYMPLWLIRDLCLAWHKRTGKKVMNIYRCFVTPTKVEIKGYKVLNDEAIKISEGWTATLQGRDRFVSVEHVKFLKFDGNRTRMAPYAVTKLPSVRLAKETENTPTIQNAPNRKVANGCANGNADALDDRTTPTTPSKTLATKRGRDDTEEASQATATGRSATTKGTKNYGLRAEETTKHARVPSSPSTGGMPN